MLIKVFYFKLDGFLFIVFLIYWSRPLSLSLFLQRLCVLLNHCWNSRMGRMTTKWRSSVQNVPKFSPSAFMISRSDWKKWLWQLWGWVNQSIEQGICVSLWFAYLKNSSSDSLHTWQICCWGATKVQCWNWYNLDTRIENNQLTPLWCDLMGKQTWTKWRLAWCNISLL